MVFDLVFVFLAVVFALLGYLRGFVREIFSLAAFVLAAILTNPLSTAAAKSLGMSSFDAVLLLPVVKIVVFFAVYFAVILIGKIFSALVPADGFFGYMNKKLGAATGFLKGLLIVVFFAWILGAIFFVLNLNPPASKKSFFFSLCDKRNPLKKSEEVKKIKKVLKYRKYFEKHGLGNSQILEKIRGAVGEGNFSADSDFEELKKNFESLKKLNEKLVK
ncbi:MAG: CvpA family protein [Elusimicrobia bacterium]|nr:CvpA family protein [Elusimicrobiota bacterium]